MPTDNRATAERLAREVYEKYSKDNGTCYFPLSSQGEDDRERAILCALAGLTHRDRTAEREAASKWWTKGAVWARCQSPVSKVTVADGFAAEFGAGERVTLSDGSVVWRDNDGQWCRGPATDLWKVRSFDWTSVLNANHTGADFDAVRRLAEQRGAER